MSQSGQIADCMEIIFDKLSITHQTSSATIKALLGCTSQPALTALLLQFDLSEDDFEADEWTRITNCFAIPISPLGPLNLTSHLTPVESPKLSSSTFVVPEEYLGASTRAGLVASPGTPEFARVMASFQKAQRQQSHMAVETNAPTLINAHEAKVILFLAAYRQYLLDGGKRGLIELIPLNVRHGLYVAISGFLPIDPTTGIPPKWNDIPEPELISLLFQCFGSAFLSDSRPAPSLFYDLRMRPAPFDINKLLDYFAKIAELLDTYITVMATIGFLGQLKEFLKYLQPPAYRQMLKDLVRQCTAWHQVWPIANRLKDNFQIHQQIEIAMLRYPVTYNLPPIVSDSAISASIQPPPPSVEMVSNSALVSPTPIKSPTTFTACINCKDLPAYQALKKKHLFKHCTANCLFAKCVKLKSAPHLATACTLRPLHAAHQAHQVFAAGTLGLHWDADAYGNVHDYDYEQSDDDDDN